MPVPGSSRMKTMSLPDGDQSDSKPAVTVRTPVPSRFIVKTSRPPSRVLVNESLCPDGAGDG
jgi:hypothetical protein